jgi:hypothetical protein
MRWGFARALHVESSLHDASSAPSGEMSQPFTASPWPLSTSAHAPLAASHTRSVLSLLADTRKAPSGVNTQPFTRASCPLSTVAHVPWRVSHSRSVRSSPPVASREVSAGEKAAHTTRPACPAASPAGPPPPQVASRYGFMRALSGLACGAGEEGEAFFLDVFR